MAKRPSRIGIDIPKAEKKRSTENLEQTRQLIIDGLLQSVAEVGLHNTSSAEISKRTGVTWGAVVYHFGDKHGLLIAAVEQGLDILLQNLQQISASELSLEERIDRFIECARRGLQNPYLRAHFEIQMCYIPVRDSKELQEQMTREWNGEWQRIFGDAALDKRDMQQLSAYTRAVLTGFTYARGFSRGDEYTTPNLDILGETLKQRLLSAAPAKANKGRR